MNNEEQPLLNQIINLTDLGYDVIFMKGLDKDSLTVRLSDFTSIISSHIQYCFSRYELYSAYLGTENVIVEELTRMKNKLDKERTNAKKNNTK